MGASLVSDDAKLKVANIELRIHGSYDRGISGKGVLPSWI